MYRLLSFQYFCFLSRGNKETEISRREWRKIVDFFWWLSSRMSKKKPPALSLGGGGAGAVTAESTDSPDGGGIIPMPSTE